VWSNVYFNNSKLFGGLYETLINNVSVSVHLLVKSINYFYEQFFFNKNKNDIHSFKSKDYIIQHR